MQEPALSATGEFPLTLAPPLVVLDTNVALDWLLFQEPAVSALATAVAARRMVWVATDAMRSELAHVLARGLAAVRRADAAAVLAAWDTHVVLRPTAPPHRLTCTDPDDQKFIDLAISTRARWLISRDRAVLKLARRAAPLGLTIVRPAAWRAGL
jgi:putative PIN family toxin of toxin-antitoxin system